MRDNEYVVNMFAILGRIQIPDFAPELVDSLKDICTTFSSWETIKEPSNLHLLFTILSKVIWLEVAEFLLPYARFNVHKNDVFFKAHASIPQSLVSPLEWRQIHDYILIPDNFF